MACSGLLHDKKRPSDLVVGKFDILSLCMGLFHTTDNIQKCSFEILHGSDFSAKKKQQKHFIRRAYFGNAYIHFYLFWLYLTPLKHCISN